MEAEIAGKRQVDVADGPVGDDRDSGSEARRGGNEATGGWKGGREEQAKLKEAFFL